MAVTLSPGIRKLFFFSILFFVFGVVGIIFRTVFLSETKIALPLQTKIQNELKISVRPYIYSKQNTINFMLELESFEHADLALLDVEDSSMLLDTGKNPILPSKWQELEKSEYKQKGILYFEPDELSPGELILSIFELEEQQFIWEYK